MRDLSSLKLEDFQTCLGQTFTVTPEDTDSLELELIQVKPIGVFDSEAEARQSFSLLFSGPLEPMLPQRLYELQNVTLGKLQIFLVPVGPDESVMLYDATFN